MARHLLHDVPPPPAIHVLEVASKQQFHVNDVEPVPKFVTHLFEVAHLLKFEFGVQGNAGGLFGVDGSNNNSMTQRARATD